MSEHSFSPERCGTQLGLQLLQSIHLMVRHVHSEIPVSLPVSSNQFGHCPLTSLIRRSTELLHAGWCLPGSSSAVGLELVSSQIVMAFSHGSSMFCLVVYLTLL